MPRPNLIEIAIGLPQFRSEAKLAQAAGCSQAAINKAKRGLHKGQPVSIRMADRIHRATNGVISKWALRPDFFDAPQNITASGPISEARA